MSDSFSYGDVPTDVPVYNSYDSAPNYDSSTVISAPDGSSFNWAGLITPVSQAVSGVLNGVGSVINAQNAKPVAGSYSATTGRLIPLTASSGVLSTPGQTSIIGNATQAAGSALNGIGGMLQQVTPYIPYLIGGIVALFLLKRILK